MATEIRVPTLGESVTEATIGRWFKKAGETVKADEPLVELETDKVTIEVPAPVAGVIAEQLVADGETVGVGALLGTIEAQRGNDAAAAAAFRMALQGKFDPTVAARAAEATTRAEGGVSESSAALFQRALAAAPPDAPWREYVEQRLKEPRLTK